MTSDPLFYLIIVACISVFAVLMLGVGSFAKSGKFYKKYANIIMRWRIGLQFFAVLLIVLYAWLRNGG
ncbi:MAG: twin transmembrane helix small protein [Paracoccaceae bacterium]